MRFLFALLLTLCLALPAAGPGLADDPRPVDLLLDRLAEADGPTEATTLAEEIVAAWMEPQSPTIRLLMSRAGQGLRNEDAALALDLLDQVVVLAPDYIEGWNKRATLQFFLGNFGASLGDIEHVLVLEPRHFGALTGLATILERLDRPEAALEVYERLLAVHPFAPGALERRDALRQSLSGQPI